VDLHSEIEEKASGQAVQWQQREDGPRGCDTDGRPRGGSRERWKGGPEAHGRVGKTAEAAAMAGQAAAAVQHAVAARRDHAAVAARRDHATVAASLRRDHAAVAASLRRDHAAVAASAWMPGDRGEDGGAGLALFKL